MWHDEGKLHMKKTCPECQSDLEIQRIDQTTITCRPCNEYQKYLMTCPDLNCDFESLFCVNCSIFKPLKEKDAQVIINKIKKKQKVNKVNPQSELRNNTGWCILIPVIIGLLAFLLYLNSSGQSQDVQNIHLLKRLRHQFPLQKNETWYHILSVLEQKMPTVKSITLLHGNDRKTSECLARELVNIFSRNVKIGEVTFDLDKIKYSDYGEVLKHYHTVVKRFKVLVTNLNVVPSEIARVFHSLCDEVSSDIKPSLFIFTLRWNKHTENLKPLEKATAILKQAWSNLPDSDMFPLLSRIVKNVVEVVPEKQATC